MLLGKTMESATRGDTLPVMPTPSFVMPSKARHLLFVSFPRKRESRKKWIPIFMGMTKKLSFLRFLFVIPAKAGIQSIYKEEWIPFYKGMTEENPGSPIRSGMTFYSSFPNASIGNPYFLVIPKVLILHLRNPNLYKNETPRR